MVKASINLAISPLNTKKAALKYDGLTYIPDFNIG